MVPNNLTSLPISHTIMIVMFNTFQNCCCSNFIELPYIRYKAGRLLLFRCKFHNKFFTIQLTINIYHCGENAHQIYLFIYVCVYCNKKKVIPLLSFYSYFSTVFHFNSFIPFDGFRHTHYLFVTRENHYTRNCFKERIGLNKQNQQPQRIKNQIHIK